MKFKKAAALILCVLLLLSLTSCKDKGTDSVTSQEASTEYVNQSPETFVENQFNTEAAILNTTSESAVQESVTTSTEAVSDTSPVEAESNVKETAPTTTQPQDNPADWSKARIVEEYKKAAQSTHSSAKSIQNITLKEIRLNNGEYDSAISLVKPIIAKFIESKSTENDGITGGFNKLSVQDVNSAKAYNEGNNTVIEMTMIEQTAGAKDDPLSGSVGHAISTVGDISAVTKDLADMGLPLEISENDTKIYYTSPMVKVVINEDGKIISGSWSYTVEISMSNLKAFGKTVDNATIVMDNKITL